MQYNNINPHNTDIFYCLIIPCGVRLDPRPRFTICTSQNETDCLYLLVLDISCERESENATPQPHNFNPSTLEQLFCHTSMNP